MKFPSIFKGATDLPSNDNDAVRESYSIRTEGTRFDELRLSLSGRVHLDNTEHVKKELMEVVDLHPMQNIVLDLSEIRYLDSSGAVTLAQIHRRCRGLHNSLKLVNVPSEIKTVLHTVEFDREEPKGILEPIVRPNVLIQLAEGAISLLKKTSDMLTFLGASFLAVVEYIVYPDKFKWQRLWKEIETNGSDSVPIVAVLGFLMGVILAFQGAIQLRQIGANIFVADLVSIAISLEMGPLLTALIMCGRSGAAFAAHIGTMKVTEEVDALRVTGSDPIRYLAAPRILAVAIALPFLTLIADVIGIVGGCVVASLSLDLTPGAYFGQVGSVLQLDHVIKGLVKSLVFGIEIAIVGCFSGFQVRGGAAGVGAATTSAVVASIFIIVATNGVFGVVFHYAQFI